MAPSAITQPSKSRVLGQVVYIGRLSSTTSCIVECSVIVPRSAVIGDFFFFVCADDGGGSENSYRLGRLEEERAAG